MVDPSSPVQDIVDIVDTNCNTLLKKMQTDNPKVDADIGISVALYYPKDSTVPGFCKYGSAGPNIDITPETVYGLGSLTKVFTAALAAYLSEQGKIGDLNATLVGPYLPVSGPYWEKVTFEQFATQTSGMPRVADGPYANQLFNDQPPPPNQISWWNNNQNGFLDNLTCWLYSNAGFVTLGFAVAAAAEQGYTALLNEAITGPLDMPNTFAASDVPPDAGLAWGYNSDQSEVSITCAADLKSSAQDMLTFLAAVYEAMQLQASGGSLTPLQWALWDTAQVWIPNPYTCPDHTPTSFSMGLGWQIPTIDSSQVLVKDGLTSLGGCSCWAGLTRYDPAVPPVGIALMTNQVNVPPDLTGHTIFQEILQGSSASDEPPSGGL